MDTCIRQLNTLLVVCFFRAQSLLRWFVHIILEYGKTTTWKCTLKNAIHYQQMQLDTFANNSKMGFADKTYIANDTPPFNWRVNTIYTLTNYVEQLTQGFKKICNQILMSCQLDTVIPGWSNCVVNKYYFKTVQM